MCCRVPFAGKVHCWLFAAGLLILLAATATLLRTARPDETVAARSDLYAQVLGVVQQWESCPTCHTAPADSAPLDRAFTALVHRPIEWPASAPDRLTSTRMDTVSSKMVTAGQRLLDLLPSDDPQVERAAQEYLAVAQALRAVSDTAVQLTVLQRLAQLDAVLRDLRGAADAKAFWRAPTPADSGSASPVALLSIPVPLVAVLVPGLLVGDRIRLSASRRDSKAESIPAQTTEAISRRGPPASALVAMLDSAPEEDCRFV